MPNTTDTQKLRAVLRPLVDRLEDHLGRPVPLASTDPAGFIAALEAHDDKREIALGLRGIVGGDSRLSAVVVDDDE